MNTIRMVGSCGWVVLTWVFAAHAQAQTLYRCGNSYQDKPCAAGQPGKIIKDVGRTEAASASAGAAGDAQCSLRGAAAQKIVWSREAGALEAHMLDKAQDEGERDLIREVYRQRATAPEMKRMIEANCIKEKQSPKSNAVIKMGANQPLKDATNAGVAQLGKSDQKNQGKNEGNNETEAGEIENKVTLSEEEKKKAMCAKLREEILYTISLQRKGGSHAEAEAYNKRKYELDSQFFRTGC